MDSDACLIDKAKQGDVHAANQLAQRYYEKLRVYFARLPREDARDSIQRVLEYTVARLDRFRGHNKAGQPVPFAGFVFAVARRVFADYWRPRGIEGRFARDTMDLDEELFGAETPADERLWQVHQRSQQTRIIERAVRQIPKIYRVVVRLHLRGLDNFEIAKKLNLQYHTTRSRLSRGLKFLCENLKNSQGDMEALERSLSPWESDEKLQISNE